MQVRFPVSAVPTHDTLSVCFIVYDLTLTLETSLQFRVNDGHYYVILDNSTNILDAFSTVCKSIDSSDVTNTLGYTVTLWYEGHSTSGFQLGSSVTSPNGWSFLNSDASNAPTARDSAMTWAQDANEYSVYLIAVRHAVTCTAANFSVPVDSSLLTVGSNTVGLKLIHPTDGTVTSTSNLIVAGITAVSVTDGSSKVALSTQTVTATVYGTATSVVATVTADQGVALIPASNISLVDGGSQGDATAGDGTFSGHWTPSAGGWYTISVLAMISGREVTGSGRVFVNDTRVGIIGPVAGTVMEYWRDSVQVRIPTNAVKWGVVTSSNASLETSCQSSGAKRNHTVSHSNGSYSLSYSLKGDTDAIVEFPPSLLPRGKQISTDICVYLYDNSDVEEDGFAIQVNNNSIPYVIDDAEIPVGKWYWVCVTLNQTDIAEHYFIAMYYINRLSTSGVTLSLDNSEPAYYSGYDTTTRSRETLTYYSVIYELWSNSYDYVVDLRMSTEEYRCPTVEEERILVPEGEFTASLWVTFDNGTTSFFNNTYIGSKISLSKYPTAVKLGNSFNISVTINTASDPKSMTGYAQNLHTNATEYNFPAGFTYNASLSGKNKRVYVAQFKPSTLAPYRIFVNVDYDGITGKNATFEVGAHISKAAVVFSETTHNVTDFRSLTGETEELYYLMSLGQAQKYLYLAGISFDIVDETILSDKFQIRQYDLLIFNAMQYVPDKYAVEWRDNVRDLVRNEGLNIICVGELFSSNEYMQTRSPNTAYEVMLNTQFGTSASNSSIELIAGNVSHGAAWRFTEGESIQNYTQVYYQDVNVKSAALASFSVNPYRVYDRSKVAYGYPILATSNGKGRVIHSSLTDPLLEGGIMRDLALWAMYGDDHAHFGLKTTPRHTVFAIRVDADISYNTPSTVYTLPIYRNVTEDWHIVGGWYIVNEHTHKFATHWDDLREAYYKMENAGHELGSHSFAHPGDMNTLTDARVTHELDDSRIQINEKLFRDIKGMVNPGTGPHQKRLWEIAQNSSYEYYSGLDYNTLGALGYLVPGQEVVNFQENLRADYDLLVVEKKSHFEVTDIWKRQYDTLNAHGDGEIIFAIWHEYPMDDDPDGDGMFANFTRYIGENFDYSSETPVNLVRIWKAWTKQRLEVVEVSADNGGKAYNLTRYGDASDPWSTQWAHVTPPHDGLNTSTTVSVMGDGVEGYRWGDRGRILYFKMTKNIAHVAICPKPFGGYQCKDCDPYHTGYPTCTTTKCAGGETCSNQGTCTSEGCVCQKGLMGLTCDFADCPQDCNRHGSCTGYDTCSCHDDDVRGHWTGEWCGECKNGYTEPNCTARFCELSSCNGRGSCAANSGLCTCNANYTGSNCETPVCSGGCGIGLCTSPEVCTCPLTAIGEKCSDCATGWYGAACNKACPACGARGTCNGGISGTGTCSCKEGWSGSLCTTEIHGRIYGTQLGNKTYDYLPTSSISNGDWVGPTEGSAFTFALADYDGVVANTSTETCIPVLSAVLASDKSSSSSIKINGSSSVSLTAIASGKTTFGKFTLADSGANSVSKAYKLKIVCGSRTLYSSSDISVIQSCAVTCMHGTCNQASGAESACVCETGYSGTDCSTADTVASSDTGADSGIFIFGTTDTLIAASGVAVLLILCFLCAGACVAVVVIAILILVMTILNKKRAKALSKIGPLPNELRRQSTTKLLFGLEVGNTDRITEQGVITKGMNKEGLNFEIQEVLYDEDDDEMEITAGRKANALAAILGGDNAGNGKGNGNGNGNGNSKPRPPKRTPTSPTAAKMEAAFGRSFANAGPKKKFNLERLDGPGAVAIPEANAPIMPPLLSPTGPNLERRTLPSANPKTFGVKPLVASPTKVTAEAPSVVALVNRNAPGQGNSNINSNSNSNDKGSAKPVGNVDRSSLGKIDPPKDKDNSPLDRPAFGVKPLSVAVPKRAEEDFSFLDDSDLDEDI